MRKRRKLAPIIPGEILAEDFMSPHGLSGHQLALALRVPATRISGILRGTRAISSDTAIRLARFFNTTATFWMNLQVNYDLRRCEETIRADVERDVTPIATISYRRAQRRSTRKVISGP